MPNTGHFVAPLLYASFVASLVTAPVHAQGFWSFGDLGNNASIKYSISHTKDGSAQNGTFSFSTAQTGGQMMATVQATLGDNSCSSTVPAQNAQSVQVQLMMSCMMFAPVAIAMFTPTWAMFLGGNWALGSQTSMNQGTSQLSFEINESCSEAGLDGLLAVMKTNEATWTTCANYPDTPFPLSFSFTNEGEVITAVLTEYNPGS